MLMDLEVLNIVKMSNSTQCHLQDLPMQFLSKLCGVLSAIGTRDPGLQYETTRSD